MFKKINLFAVLFFLGVSLFAKEVPLFMAQKVASNFLSVQPSMRVNQVSLSLFDQMYDKNNQTALYLFEISSGGFVVVPADDRMFPVLAFSDEYAIADLSLNPALKEWLDAYVVQFERVIQESLADATVQAAWDSYLTESQALSLPKTTQVGPLILTTWNQDNFYNAMCPEDPAGPGGRVYAGCVATAMGQVMKYYNYPPQGTGTHSYHDWDYGQQYANFGATTYNWTHMPNNLNGQNDEVARLLYHLGVSVNMGYSPDGSGAQSDDVVPALRNYFGYSNSINIKDRNNYTDQQWITMLKNNIDAGMPLYYSAYSDDGGHAFNFDGYYDDTQGSYFHVNWGWGGYGNGFFLLNNLNSPGGNFDSWHQAIFNIIPAQNYPSFCTGSKTITGSIGTFEDGSSFSDYQNNSSCSWLIDPDINVLTIKLSFDKFNTQSGSDVVTVYDGDNTSAPVLGTFSGSTLPPQITSTGNKMLVTFITNGSVSGEGWAASYSTNKPVYCFNVTTLEDPAGTFGDGSGTYEYNSGTNCRWRIQPPNVNQISLSFLDFDIESDAVLEVYDISSSPTVLLDSYSGSNLPAQKNYAVSKLLLWFKAGQQMSNGWTASYSTTPASVQELTADGFEMYPNPAQNILYLNFKSLPQTCEIQLINFLGQTMTSFHPQNNVTPLDISSFNSGTYFLKIISGNSVINKTFIKL